VSARAGVVLRRGCLKAPMAIGNHEDRPRQLLVGIERADWRNSTEYPSVL
jgi:hypothetical protein